MSDSNYEFEDEVEDQATRKDPVRARMRELEQQVKAFEAKAKEAEAAQRELAFVKEKWAAGGTRTPVLALFNGSSRAMRSIAFQVKTHGTPNRCANSLSSAPASASLTPCPARIKGRWALRSRSITSSSREVVLGAERRPCPPLSTRSGAGPPPAGREAGPKGAA